MVGRIPDTNLTPELLDLRREHTWKDDCHWRWVPRVNAEEKARFSKKYPDSPWVTEFEKADRLYKIWTGMKHRCHGIGDGDKVYKWYRDKGISVCTEWRYSFAPFYFWAIGNGYAEGLTIDRIDGDGNYCPENCRWVTRSENSKNKKPKLKKPKKQKLPNMSIYRTLTEEELMTAARLWEALERLPEEKKQYVLGYAEAIADVKTGKITVEVANECNSGEQSGTGAAG